MSIGFRSGYPCEWRLWLPFISLTLGLGLAYALANWRFRGKEALDALPPLPMVPPPTVLGYYLLVMLGRDSFLGKLHEQIWGGPLVFTWQAAVVASTVHAPRCW